MNTAIIIAVIALVASIVSAIVTVFGPPVLQARRDAKETLEKYSGPLLDSSYELQARLHNLLTCKFDENYIRKNEPARREAAINTVLAFPEGR